MPLPRLIIPLLVVLALVGGYTLRAVFTQPTVTEVFVNQPGEQGTFIVDGVRCRGTALLLASLYEGKPGILSLQAYASERKVVFTFDPAATSIDQIRAVMEAPIAFDDGTTSQVFRCVSVHGDRQGGR